MTSDLKLLSEIYETEDVQRALHKISDKYSGEIRVVEENGAKYIVVNVRSVDDDIGAPDSVLKNLQIEIQDQSLRRKIRKDTEQHRNLILAHTFSHLTRSNDE